MNPSNSMKITIDEIEIYGSQGWPRWYDVTNIRTRDTVRIDQQSAKLVALALLQIVEDQKAEDIRIGARK